jgi:hypothetical protein
MGMQEAEEAVGVCDGHDDADFAGPPGAATIAAAEAALGLALPPTYRRFVERLGAGSIGGFEVYGVITEPFDGPLPDAVWATLDARHGPGALPATMILVGDDGMGGSYVLDTANGVEPPVEVWAAGGSEPGDREQLAGDFGAFLLEQVRLQLSGS